MQQGKNAIAVKSEGIPKKELAMKTLSISDTTRVSYVNLPSLEHSELIPFSEFDISNNYGYPIKNILIQINDIYALQEDESYHCLAEVVYYDGHYWFVWPEDEIEQAEAYLSPYI